MTRFTSTAIAAFLFFASSAQSFSSHGSFTPRNFQPKGAVVVAESKTALSMNLFDRFTRVAKSNINNVLKNLEDPEKIMTQAVDDMQTDLVSIRQSYAEVTATQRRLMKQKEQADALGEDWYKRAQLALQKGSEDLAREALNRRQQQVDTAAGLQAQIDTQAASIDKLYEGMSELEKRIMEAKGKKEEMVARAKTAASTQKVNDMLGGITGKTSMDAFSRMEEKVEALEASAEVSAEMGALEGKALPGSVESEFRKLEASDGVEDELSKLKGLLGGSEPSASPSSSSSSPSSSSKPSDAMDDELEKLKKAAGL